VTANTNLQNQPKTVRVKQLVVQVDKSATGDVYGFFPFDIALNKCTLKGIRAEFNGITTAITPGSDYIFVGYNDAKDNSLLLCLVDNNGQRVVSDYPVTALGVDNAHSVLLNPTRRFNCSNLNWGRCYVHFGDGSVVFGKMAIMFSIYYTDK